MAWAASSTTASPRRRAIATTGSMSAGGPRGGGGPAARGEHRGGGGDEGEGGGDDLVAGPDIQRAEREMQGVGARGDADPVAHAAERGDLGLQGLPLGAEDEAARRQDALGGGEQLRPERRVLAGQVDLRDHCPGRLPTWPTPRRFTEKFTSSSLRPTPFAPRLMYVTLMAAPWQCTSTPTRDSTLVPALMS